MRASARRVGSLAFAAAVAAAVYIAMGLRYRYEYTPETSDGRVERIIGTAPAVSVEPVLFLWALFLVVTGLAGWLGARNGIASVVWVTGGRVDQDQALAGPALPAAPSTNARTSPSPPLDRRQRSW